MYRCGTQNGQPGRGGESAFKQTRVGGPESEAEFEEHRCNINYSAAAPLVLSSCASQEVAH